MEDRVKTQKDLLLAEEVYAVVGAAFEVYNSLGSGFVESVFQEALEMELGDRAIPFVTQAPLRILYKGRPLKKEFIADLVVFENLIVELKAIQGLTDREDAQLINYLKATHKRVGLLLNFGNPSKLEWRRLVL
jgi:GxxExxY protein